MAWDWRTLSFRRIVGLALFVGSYVCLYLGLYGALVYYEDNVAIEASWLNGNQTHLLEQAVTELINIMGDNAKVPIIPPTTRSLVADRTVGNDWSLLHVLLDKAEKGETSYLPAYTLIFFGMVLPAFKFLTVVYWMVSPFPGGGQAVTVAARMTRWTAVDAVAEAMIVALLLRSDVMAEHRKGYLCFVCYVILSAAAIWVMDESNETKGPSLAARCWHRLCGCRLPAGLTVVTGLGFLGTAAVGATMYPLAHVYVPPSQIKSSVEWTLHPYQGLLKSVGEADDVERLITEILPHLPVVYGEASVVGAVQTLLCSGHVFTIAGSVMLFTGIILCPVLEALLGIMVAFQASSVTAVVAEKDEEAVALLTDQEGAAATGPAHSWHALLLEMAADLSMLDVFVTGMAVASTVLASLGDVLVTELDTGFWVLIPAVVLGWIHNALCAIVAYDGAMRGARNKVILNARSKQEEQKKKAAEERKPNSVAFFACCSRPAGTPKIVPSQPATTKP
eukprot:TRINITY_DN10184_c0_g3_i1.p1 TRINITY_DN10184_c0_g3~~TRINITY_DN10184_c0_g3_i1.p1  ORF type:complete len:506 (-),score=102.78 TRINITY_DN10184_c0_g3_i1:356-1873(-)